MLNRYHLNKLKLTLHLVRSLAILTLSMMIGFLSACTPPSVNITEVIIPTTPTPTTTRTPTNTLQSTSTPTTPTSPTNTQTPLAVCSPLENIPIQQLEELVSNPFNPPRPGSDDPHQGVDLADIDPVTRIALVGRQVQAIIAGSVAGVIDNRFPYGNALLIETPIQSLPKEWQSHLAIPTPGPIVVGHPVLTCPTSASPPIENISERSLYILYAHLKSPPDFAQGTEINCGAGLGSIGQSGNALNPHVHIEVRVGPAGARIDSMAHYIGNASPQEMTNYCQWRVSGRFQLVDPIRVFNLLTD